MKNLNKYFTSLLVCLCFSLTGTTTAISPEESQKALNALVANKEENVEYPLTKEEFETALCLRLSGHNDGTVVENLIDVAERFSPKPLCLDDVTALRELIAYGQCVFIKEGFLLKFNINFPPGQNSGLFWPESFGFWFANWGQPGQEYALDKIDMY